MQRPTTQHHPITIEDLNFIDHVAAHLNQHQTFQNSAGETYDARTLLSDLKSFLIDPDNVTLHELCELLPNLKNYDRMTLLNKRPTLIKDASDLIILLRYIGDDEECLLLACSQIEKLFHHDVEIIGRNIILVASKLHPFDQLIFCKFAMHAMLKQCANQTLHTPYTQENIGKQRECFSASFLLSVLACASYFTKSAPALTVIALIGAIASAAKGVSHLDQGKRLSLELYRTYSIWKQAISTSNLEKSATTPRSRRN